MSVGHVIEAAAAQLASRHPRADEAAVDTIWRAVEATAAGRTILGDAGESLVEAWRDYGPYDQLNPERERVAFEVWCRLAAAARTSVLVGEAAVVLRELLADVTDPAEAVWNAIASAAADDPNGSWAPLNPAGRALAAAMVEHRPGEHVPLWARSVISQRDIRHCRNCGCTDERGCFGGCTWVRPDLCSACQSGLPWSDADSDPAAQVRAAADGGVGSGTPLPAYDVPLGSVTIDREAVGGIVAGALESARIDAPADENAIAFYGEWGDQPAGEIVVDVGLSDTERVRMGFSSVVEMVRVRDKLTAEIDARTPAEAKGPARALLVAAVEVHPNLSVEWSPAAVAGYVERLLADDDEIASVTIAFQSDGELILFQDGYGGMKLPRQPGSLVTAFDGDAAYSVIGDTLDGQARAVLDARGKRQDAAGDDDWAPRLSYATTGQLLYELAVRVELGTRDGRSYNDHDWLITMLGDVKERLLKDDPQALEFRPARPSAAFDNEPPF